MLMQLYKVVNRELVHVKAIEVPDNIKHCDSWLYHEGYSRDYTLRRGMVKPLLSDKQRKALDGYVKSLKMQGKLPSMLDRMIENIK